MTCTVTGIPLEDGDMLYELVQRFFKREPGVEGMTPDGLKAMDPRFVRPDDIPPSPASSTPCCGVWRARASQFWPDKMPNG